NRDFSPAAELPSQSLPIPVDQPGYPDAPAGSASTISPPYQRSVSEILRRPATLIVAGGAVLSAALIIAVALHRSKPAPLPVSAPPPELFNERARAAATSASASAASSPPAPIAPAPSAPPAVPEAAVQE